MDALMNHFLGEFLKGEWLTAYFLGVPLAGAILDGWVRSKPGDAWCKWFRGWQRYFLFGLSSFMAANAFVLLLMAAWGDLSVKEALLSQYDRDTALGVTVNDRGVIRQMRVQDFAGENAWKAIEYKAGASLTPDDEWRRSWSYSYQDERVINKSDVVNSSVRAPEIDAVLGRIKQIEARGYGLAISHPGAAKLSSLLSVWSYVFLIVLSCAYYFAQIGISEVAFRRWSGKDPASTENGS